LIPVSAAKSTLSVNRFTSTPTRGKTRKTRAPFDSNDTYLRKKKSMHPSHVIITTNNNKNLQHIHQTIVNEKSVEVERFCDEIDRSVWQCDNHKRQTNRVRPTSLFHVHPIDTTMCI
jgi:hypothetical protein